MTGGPIRVVVVDDDDETRRIVQICLSLEDGFEVVGEAADGRTAVEVVQGCQPDVVLLDLEMPGMNGLEAIPSLRRAAPAAKIAVLSAFPDPFTLADALTRGADTYLDKAMGLAELPLVLSSLVNESEGSEAG
ncbi:MAG: response regulator [Acidimicrobiales bacterium]